jgi:hypothetical protein
MVTDRFIEALDKAGNEVAPPRDDQPVAWSFELARAVGPNGYCNFAPPILSFNFPRVPDGAVRNIIPLYTYPLADQAELARLKAEVARKDAALEKAESHFYNMANAINDEDYRGSVPGIDGVVVGHREEYHKGHVERLVKYAEEARAALTPSQEPRT